MKPLELLSSDDLSQMIDVPESTVNDWLSEFQLFIPKTKKRDELYYLPEAVNVLQFIKTCYDQNNAKSQIVKWLADRSFPEIARNSMENDQSDKGKKGTNKENFVTMMQTIGKTVANVASQEKLLQMVKEQQSKHNRRIKMIEKQAEEIDNLKLEIKQIKDEQPSGDTYQQKKQAFARLFNGC